jgi:hypothetical protein
VFVLRHWWAVRGTILLRLAVALMAVVAIVWLGYEFWRLLWQSTPIWQSSFTGAFDLRLRHSEVHQWFAGQSVYTKMTAAYPPASYLMLWPLLGWLGPTSAGWLWAATTVGALGWLAHLIVQESGATTPLERAFVALIPLSMYATGATIGNGQLIVHLLPLLVAGLLLLRRERCGWCKDLMAAALLLVTLVKPSISVPFFWIVLFVPGRPRPALLIMLGYVCSPLLRHRFRSLGSSRSSVAGWHTAWSGPRMDPRISTPGS